MSKFMACDWFNSDYGVLHGGANPAARSRRNAGRHRAGPLRGAEPADGDRAAWRRSAWRETAAMIGDGVAVLVERAFAARGETPDERAVADVQPRLRRPCRRREPAVSRRAASRCGTAPAEGWRLAVCTNKPEAAARELLEATRPDAAVRARSAAATVSRCASPIRRICWPRCGSAGGEPAAAVMVGDHANDVLAARGAGVKCVFVTWGYGPSAWRRAPPR